MFGIPSLLEKLASAKVAAAIALSSFVLLCASVTLFVLQHLDQFSQVNAPANTNQFILVKAIPLSERISKVIAILEANSNSKTLIAIIVFSIALVISCCFCVIEFLVTIRTGLRELFEKYMADLKLQVEDFKQMEAEGELSLHNEELLDKKQRLLDTYLFISIFFNALFTIAIIVIFVLLVVIVLKLVT